MLWCTTSKQLYIKIREIYILIAVGMENREREKRIRCQSNVPFKKAAHILCPRKLREVLDWRNILIHFEVFSTTVKSLYKAVK